MAVNRLMGWLSPQRLTQLAFHVRPNSEFLIYNGQRLTRRQVHGRIRALAAGLQALGFRKGDRLATLLPSCPESVYSLFLPGLIGNTLVSLNPLLGEQELRHILRDSGARAIILRRDWFGLDHAATLARLSPDLPDLRYVILVDPDRDGAGEGGDGSGRLPSPSAGSGVTFLPLSRVMRPEDPVHRVGLHPDDLTRLSYTSGTTGRPKGVMHSRRRAWGLASTRSRSRIKLSALRCMLLPYPPYHMAGLFAIVVGLLAGGKIILMDRLDPHRMLAYVQEEKVTQIAGSPTMYRLLMSTSGQERYDLSSVQRIAFSSEQLSRDLARALSERMGCHLENMYGTTEAIMISWTGLDDGWRRVAETVGRPAPGVSLRIVDDARQPLPTGERGEIAVQTTQMMLGYYQAPELTAEHLDAEGWFYTGDIGTMDGDGTLRLVDRKKDLIIRGGQNIYPAEVERYLRSHPAVRRAAVIGVPDPVAGEAVWAYVERQPGTESTVQELRAFCTGQIAPFKIPVEVRFVERLPTNATGKVIKFELRERRHRRGEPR